MGKSSGILAATALAALSFTTGAEAGGAGIGGCYVRADAGYGWNTDDKGIAQISPGFGTAIGPVEQPNFTDSWFGEVGIGCRLVRQHMSGGGSIKDAPVASYHPSPIRGDITYAFHGERKFHGVPLNPPSPPPTFVDPVDAKLHTNTLMFNVYYDLPAMHRITPYIGAGLGMAFLEMRDITFTNGVVVRLDSKDETKFAWSLMAGVSIDLGSKMVLDVGYRYLNVGDITASSPAHGYSLKLNDTSQHQAKIGIRIPLSFN